MLFFSISTFPFLKFGDCFCICCKTKIVLSPQKFRKFSYFYASKLYAKWEKMDFRELLSEKMTTKMSFQTYHSDIYFLARVTSR